MSRVLLWITAALIAIVGLLSLSAAGATFTYLADPGTLSEEFAPLQGSNDAHAILIDIEGATATVNGIALPGRPQIRVLSDQPITAGIATASDADAALAGVAYDVATLADGAWTLREVPGTGGASPAQAGWMRTGDDLSLEAQDGATLVIANADGSAGVGARMSLQLPTDFARTLVLGLLILGGLLIALAIGVAAIAIGGTRHSLAADRE